MHISVLINRDKFNSCVGSIQGTESQFNVKFYQLNQVRNILLFVILEPIVYEWIQLPR